MVFKKTRLATPWRISWDLFTTNTRDNQDLKINSLIREPNQQGFQRSRAMGGETHFFHPSTDTKQEIAVMCAKVLVPWSWQMSIYN